MTIDFAAAQATIEDFYRRIYWDAAGAITYATPDYTLSYSGIGWLHSVNHLWMHQPAALDDYLLGMAADFFASYHAEYNVVVGGEALTHFAPWMAARRYHERISDPVYTLHGLPRVQHLRRDYRIARATVEQQQQILQTLYGVFFIGPEAARCLVRAEHFSDPTIGHYLATMPDGQLAACATVLLGNGIAGVWNVGTLRPYRRRGIAAALLVHALSDAAADGCTDSVLIASPMGKSLYEEIGYQYNGSIGHFGPPDFLHS